MNMQEFDIPENLNWQEWIDRWDKMQEKYIAKRSERFDIMVQLIRQTQNRSRKQLKINLDITSF